MVTDKSEDEVVAGFPETDRMAYFDARKNPTIQVHVALLAVADGYQKRGQHQEAARVLRRVVEIFPDFTGGWTELAGELSRFAPAEGDLALKRARELDPTASITLRHDALPDIGAQVERLLAVGNVREADKLVDQYASIAPDTDWAFLRMAARAKLRAGDPAAAIPFAELALKIYPRDSETKHVLGVALARTGQAARGEKLLAEVSTLFSRQPNFMVDWAEARLLAGKADSAEAPARRAVDLAPESPGSHAVLGRVLTRLQRYQPALVEFREALKYDPNSSQVWSDVSATFYLAERYDEARVAAEQAWTLSPTSARYGMNLGEVLLKSKQWAKAANVYEKVGRLDANDATSWNNLGYALLQLNRSGDAVAPLEKAVMINPNLRSAWLNLSQAARLSGRSARAKVAEQRARALPKDPNEINFK